MQYTMMLQVAFLRRIHLKQYSSPPKLSWRRMLAETSFGYLGWTWALGLVAAWINPGANGGWSWDYSCPNLLAMCYYATACLMMYDAYRWVLGVWGPACFLCAVVTTALALLLFMSPLAAAVAGWRRMV
jgi:hypothetical protein